MPLRLDPLALLGADYTAVAPTIGGRARRSVHDHLEAGEPDEQFGEAEDGTWQCLLDDAGRVETIFLFAQKGCPLPFDLQFGMSEAEIARALGPPTMTGPEQDVPVLGRKGSWARWDRPGYALHIEYSVGGSKLSMVTFMLSSVAPNAA